jgi:hypothetical protein
MRVEPFAITLVLSLLAALDARADVRVIAQGYQQAGGFNLAQPPRPLLEDAFDLTDATTLSFFDSVDRTLSNTPGYDLSHPWARVQGTISSLVTHHSVRWDMMSRSTFNLPDTSAASAGSTNESMRTVVELTSPIDSFFGYVRVAGGQDLDNPLLADVYARYAFVRVLTDDGQVILERTLETRGLLNDAVSFTGPALPAGTYRFEFTTGTTWDASQLSGIARSDAELSLTFGVPAPSSPLLLGAIIPLVARRRR